MFFSFLRDRDTHIDGQGFLFSPKVYSFSLSIIACPHLLRFLVPEIVLCWLLGHQSLEM